VLSRGTDLHLLLKLKPAGTVYKATRPHNVEGQAKNGRKRMVKSVPAGPSGTTKVNRVLPLSCGLVGETGSSEGTALAGHRLISGNNSADTASAQAQMLFVIALDRTPIGAGMK